MLERRKLLNELYKLQSDLELGDTSVYHRIHELAYLLFEDKSCNWVGREEVHSIMRRACMNDDYYIVGERAFASEYFSAATLEKCAKNFSKYHNLMQNSSPVIYGKDTHKQTLNKINLGFLGADFCNQATMYLMIEFIEKLDRERFNVFCFDHGTYTDNQLQSPMRSRVLRAFDHHVNIKGLNAEDASHLIYSKSIDILLNIKNPAASELDILHKRPAPVQISFLYYPDTSGLDCMDYIVLDKTVWNSSQYFSEKVLLIEGCYQPNDSTRYQPKGKIEFDLPDDCFVFANFSQTYKYNPRMFDLWCSLLKEPSACKYNILWLLVDDLEDRRFLIREAALRGVGDKIYFSSRASNEIHLESLNRADLVLDTFPCGGHTLTSDALWAGTPVVTMKGDTFASSVAASILCNADLSPFVAFDEISYFKIASNYMKQAKLQFITKHDLISNREIPLFSGQSYASRFTEMLERYYLIPILNHNKSLI